MKKTKLLMPLAGVGAVVATVAPIALTSCANEKLLNLVGYQPKFTAMDPKEMYAKDAAKIYFDSKDSVAIMADDIYKFLSDEEYLLKMVEELLPAWLEMDCAFDLQKAEGLASNLKVKYIADSNEAKLSGTIHLRLETQVYEADKAKTEANRIGTYTLETKHILKEVPYAFWFSTSESTLVAGHLATGIKKDKLLKDADWTITRSYSGKMTYKNNSEPVEYENQSANYNKDYVPSDQQLSFLMWNSNYMWNITEKK